jgi:hypothetical protein
MLKGKIKEGNVDNWIIVLEIMNGVIIMLIIKMDMNKMGFLKRKKKEELEEMNKGGDEEKEIGD